jgi:hypothetical protein
LTITETVLTFVVVPVGIAALITGLVYSARGYRGRRYRPGRDYDFAPVWLLASPERSGPQAAGRDGRAALAAGSRTAAWPAEQEDAENATGGTSDRW